jgi:hypothetical protein
MCWEVVWLGLLGLTAAQPPANCTQNCSATQYVDARCHCVQCAACNAQQFRTRNCTNTSNVACDQCSIKCGEHEHIAANCTATADIVCAANAGPHAGPDEEEEV